MVSQPLTMTTQGNRAQFSTAQGGVGRVAKVNVDHGVVIGYGAVCKERDESGEMQDYFDLHDEHLPEDEMLGATLKFAETARAARVMHDDVDVGQVVVAFPLDEATAKSLDLVAKRTGVLIVWKPNDRSLLQKFASGEWTGFSFGGWASKEDVP